MKIAKPRGCRKKKQQMCTHVNVYEIFNDVRVMENDRLQRIITCYCLKKTIKNFCDIKEREKKTRVFKRCLIKDSNKKRKFLVCF